LVERLCPTKTGMAITSVNKAKLEPIASPYESIEFCVKPEVTATTSSGSEVAIEITKKLIVYSDILRS
jgi:hypothetical protein